MQTSDGMPAAALDSTDYERCAPALRTAALRTAVVVPGWRDSGPRHWQSLWASRLPGARRVVQGDWITPTRAAWVDMLEQTVLAAPYGAGCCFSDSPSAYRPCVVLRGLRAAFAGGVLYSKMR